MLKTIKPGKLRGLTDGQIQKTLSEFLECPVVYVDPVAYIYCVDQYESSAQLVKHMRRLSHLGRVTVVAQGGDVAVRLAFNERAQSVIHGQTISSETQIL